MQRQVLFNKWLSKQDNTNCDRDGNNNSDFTHPKTTDRLARLTALYHSMQREDMDEEPADGADGLAGSVSDMTKQPKAKDE